MSIYNRIHNLIENRGISIEQLARDSGIDLETLDNSIKSNIPFKGAIVLAKLAKYFHVSVYWLITGHDEIHEEEKRLSDLLEENNKLIKEVVELKEYIANNLPMKYDEYLKI